MELTATDNSGMTNLQMIIAKAGSGFKVRQLQNEVKDATEDDDDARQNYNDFFDWLTKQEAMTDVEEFLGLNEKAVTKLFRKSPVSHNWVPKLEKVMHFTFKKVRTPPAVAFNNIKPRRKVTIGERMRRNSTLAEVRPFYARPSLFLKALLRRDPNGVLDKTGAEIVGEVF